MARTVLAGIAVATATGCSGGSTATLTPRSEPPPSSPASAADCPDVDDNDGGASMAIDYVDFVQAFGRQYIANLGRNVQPASRDDLGRMLLRSRCSFSAVNDRTQGNPGEPRDGDTAFLPPGTPIYALDGWSTDCRIAAELDGQVTVYLAYRDDTEHATPRPCAIRHRGNAE